ncbi:unnamed protein product [marine sediment metagenome]|uniref:Uncharacterized protein n=1 Tax=marine sediment metagenome TaxID=412755 RepID=X1IKE3_9ZZZZ
MEQAAGLQKLDVSAQRNEDGSVSVVVHGADRFGNTGGAGGNGGATFTDALESIMGDVAKMERDAVLKELEARDLDGS